MQRIAIVGLGHRAGKFIDAIAQDYRAQTQLVGFCDISTVRMSAQNRWLQEKYAYSAVPSYPPDRFEEMVRKERVEVVLVATIDNEHHSYIARALAAGCRVVTEKPMTVDAPQCRSVLAAAGSDPSRVRVAFNYRWAPANTEVKRLLASGVIGPVRSVLLEWLLDVRHGADYFRRWHSDKSSSGGLLVHKSTHHFDLVNWWTDSIPDSVYATGGLMYYGKANAVARGEDRLTHYDRYTGVEEAKSDPFRLDLGANERFKSLYLDAEKETGYIRDRNVFREGITIEDHLSVAVRYRSGLMLTYVLNAFSPREGMRVAFNGDRGRLEYAQFAKSNGATGHDEGLSGAAASVEPTSLWLYPHFGSPSALAVPTGKGGHWGGDPLLMENLFSGHSVPDPFGRSAGPEQGAASILVGIAGNQSLKEDRPIDLSALVVLNPEAQRLSRLS